METKNHFTVSKNNSFYAILPKVITMKKKDANTTMYRKQVLEILRDANPEGVTESEINDNNGALRSEARRIITDATGIRKPWIHITCDEMEEEGLIVQVLMKGGRRMFITLKGLGYLQSMADFKVGTATA